MSDSFCSELLKEMNSSLNIPEEEESGKESGVINVKYEIIAGLRAGSELMWAYEQKQLYYKNSFSKRTKETG